MMTVHFDEKVNAAYLRLKYLKDRKKLRVGIILDFDEHNQVVGIEFQHIKKRVAVSNLKLMQFGIA